MEIVTFTPDTDLEFTYETIANPIIKMNVILTVDDKDYKISINYEDATYTDNTYSKIKIYYDEEIKDIAIPIILEPFNFVLYTDVGETLNVKELVTRYPESSIIPYFNLDIPEFNKNFIIKKLKHNIATVKTFVTTYFDKLLTYRIVDYSSNNKLEFYVYPVNNLAALLYNRIYIKIFKEMDFDPL